MKKSFLLLSAAVVSFFASAQLPNINLVQVATGFTSPIDLQSCGDGRLFVMEQAGRIKILSKSGVINSTPFLDIHTIVQSGGNEQGLLGLAFSPNFKQDGYFYVNYINGSGAGSTRISRFSVNPLDSNLADASSERILLSFTQPYTNHNGATVMFGKDGYLYDTEGDGGNERDPDGYGQSTNDYLSVLLRMDVSNPDSGYIVPPSNPFVGQANFKPEIWAYGLRNAWRCSVDRITGDIWMGDVGQDTYEEVDFQPASSTGGENYGWKCREGFHACPNCNGLGGCPTSGFTDPVFEYPHTYQSNGANGCSITGGYVYRGVQYNALWGRYIFTDYCNGGFLSLKQTGPNSFDPDTLNDFANQQYTSFGQDNNGELYVCYRGTGSGGRIYRLTETTNCNPVAFVSLKDTIAGCKPVTISALQGDTLSYQWYNSTGSIGGATSYQYAAQQTGWYKVKVSKTVHAGCEAMSDSVYVLAHDTSSLSPCNCILPFCNNVAPQTLAGYITPAGGVYSGTGVNNNQFTPSQLSAGNYNIAYVYTNQFGCISHTSFPLTVNDTVALTVASGPFNYCVDDNAVSLNGIGQPAGGTYNSTFVTNDTVFNPSSAGAGSHTVTYNYIESVNTGCTSQKAFAVNVGAGTPLTVDSANKTAVGCDPSFSLDGFVFPGGGTYSGNGVSNNMFSPTVVNGTVNNTVHYVYTNGFGCVSTDSLNITVAICEGINELRGELAFSIFPNPSKGNFNLNVHVNSTQQAELIITDALGKICYRKHQLLDPSRTLISVDLPQLAKGAYSVQLKSEKTSAVKSLVIE